MPVTQKQTPSISKDRWIPASGIDALASPDVLRDWLSDEDLLTQKLRQRCGDKFRFELRGQSETKIDQPQADFLATTPGTALLREIALMCADTCVVYARTLIPETTLNRHPWLTNLDTRPLGETLRARDNCARSAFEFARLEQGDELFAIAIDQAQSASECLWARRSRFQLGDDPLLVYEIFMPAIAQCP